MSGNEAGFRSAMPYAVVVMVSVLAVCGTALRDQLMRSPAPPAESVGAGVGAVAGTPPRAVASARVQRPAEQASAAPTAPPALEGSDVVTGALPTIPGADLTGAPATAAAASPVDTAQPVEVQSVQGQPAQEVAQEVQPAPRAAPVRSTSAPAPSLTRPAATSLAVPAARRTAPLTPELALVRARLLTGRLYGGPLEDVWAAFSPRVRAEWGTFQKFEDYRVGGTLTYGQETAVLREDLTRSGGVTYYTRTATFERGPRDGWTVIFGLDSAGQVQEFGIVGAGLLPQGVQKQGVQKTAPQQAAP